ncbi:MAG: methyltransferase domain-containing protein [Halobacteriaceae archaeon]
MSHEIRNSIRDTARYLKHVRPIDPDELQTYVQGHPHPGVIREHLRDMAFDLDLIETDDGSFVPIENTTIETSELSEVSLPETYTKIIEELLIEEFGSQWDSGETRDDIRTVISRLKDRYYQQHPVEYDYEVALGYTIYHFPVYYAAGQYLMEQLVHEELIDTKIRLLDIGAGVGAPALGFHDYLPDNILVEYHAIEPSSANTILERFLETTNRNFHWEIHETTAEEFAIDQTYSVVLFGNVLIELSNPTNTVERYAEMLTEDGTMVLMSPADKQTSMHLRDVEREIADNRNVLNIHSPMVRLWSDEYPTDRGWSFVRQPEIDTPSFQQRIADNSTFIHTSVQYSYSFLRNDGRRKYDITLSTKHYAKMAEMDQHVTNRVDIVGCKLSPDLSENNNPLYKISDGSEHRDHYAVLVQETSLNEPLRVANYGSLLEFNNTLVLWNDDEQAYNLVVDEDTIVELI